MNNTTSSSQGQSQLSQLMDTIHQLRDRRCDDWWMMSSIWPTVLLSTSYYIIVRHAGPWFMKDRQVAGHTCSQDTRVVRTLNSLRSREPFGLRRVMMTYNLVQAVFNSWIFYKVFWLWRDHYDWTCQPVDYSDR